jgi:hypothetical protein
MTKSKGGKTSKLESAFYCALLISLGTVCPTLCGAASDDRLRGIAPELVVNAVAGADMEQVVLYDDRGVQI